MLSVLQRFRRALGVTVVRNGQAQTILSTLCKRYCGGGYGKYTAEANHSNNRWEAGKGEVVGILVILLPGMLLL